MKPFKKKVNLTHLLRLAVQIASFLFLPALFISAYGGVRALALALFHGDSLSGQLPQVLAAVAVLPATALMGRFFCGWMCAFGAFGDFVRGIFGRFMRFRVNEKLDKAMKKIKYILLAFLVVVCWVLGVKAFSSANPWDVFGMLGTVGQAPDLLFVLKNLAPGFALLLGIAAGSVFVERFFCRYFCPLGAMFSVVSRLRIIRVRKPSAKCGACRACTRSCAMGIPLYGRDSISSGECIGCMKCTAACPRGNVGIAVAGAGVAPLAAGAVAVAALAGAYLTTNIAQGIAEPPQGSGIAVESRQSAPVLSGESPTPAQAGTPAPTIQGTESPTASPARSSSASLYKDGTYSGSGDGYRGATTVSVTVKNDRITDVEVVSYRDDRRFFDAACPVVTGEILQAQKSEVDAVSGATYSSNGIMSAVADALSKARM